MVLTGDVFIMNVTLGFVANRPIQLNFDALYFEAGAPRSPRAEWSATSAQSGAISCRDIKEVIGRKKTSRSRIFAQRSSAFPEYVFSKISRDQARIDVRGACG